MAEVTNEQVINALRGILLPKVNRDLVSLNMVREVTCCGGVAAFRLVLPPPFAAFKDQVLDQARRAVLRLPGVEQVNAKVEVATPPPAERTPLPGVRHIIAVSSGKGGVGKTTVAVNLSVALAGLGYRVGLMDSDVYGPNVPMMMGTGASPVIVNNKVQPVPAYGVKVMSLGLLQPGDSPVVWRGPMLHGIVKQFLQDVAWGELDYLVVDMPPGTGDVQLSLAQMVPVSGAVLVTTPQEVSMADVRKATNMFLQVQVPVLGVVENMSYFLCPTCSERHEIFGHGGGAALAQKFDVPFLGEVPLGLGVREGGDAGTPVAAGNPASPPAQAFREIAQRVVEQLGLNEMPLPTIGVK